MLGTKMRSAAPRLLGEFGAPPLGKKVNRGVRSIARGDSPNSNINCESSASIINRNDMRLPTSFGKESSFRKSKHHQAHHENQVPMRRSKPSSSTYVYQPFDICPPKTGEPTFSGSSVNQSFREEGNYDEDLVAESGLILRPGMVLFKRYISLLEQVNIVKTCQELGCGPGGFYQPLYNDGAKMHLHMMCLGLDWNPQSRVYEKRRHHDNAVPPDLPSNFTKLVRRVLEDSHVLIQRNRKVENVEDILPMMNPDLCIVNFYTTNGRLGLHQDRDETRESLHKGLPVVSVSIGDTAEFLYGDRRNPDDADSVLLDSGDVVVFGGASRHIFHGVPTIFPGSAPPALLEQTNLRPGRLNLTFRKY